MAANTDNSDLIKLAQKITANGPHDHKPTARRVRGLLNGVYVFDTINAQHVWEHPYYPQFYVPLSDFSSSAKLLRDKPIDNTNGGAYLCKLSVGDVTTSRAVLFDVEPLKHLVKIDFPALDNWFEEDVPIYQHPKDPYKRVDILPSTRPIRVALGGETLAECTNSLFLFETSLRTRYYLSPTSVKWEYLTKSDTETYCPYKGRANYYNAKVNGKEYKDVVWYYQYPTAESAPVAGHLCFYNEKVDLWVDGLKEEK